MSTPEESFQRVYNRIIPFVIVIPVAFLIFFIVVSMIQLHQINTRIEEGQSQTVKEFLLKTSSGEKYSDQSRQFLTLAVLEEESLSERYRQGHYSLVSRTFKQFLGFFTGIIMVIVGSVFILLKLKEGVDLDASRGDWKLSLITSSPGVGFGVVGALLIGIASLSNDKISVRDTGLYLTREYLVAPYFTKSGSRSELDQYMLEEGQKEQEELMEQHPPKTEPTPKKVQETPGESANPEKVPIKSE